MRSLYIGLCLLILGSCQATPDTIFIMSTHTLKSSDYKIIEEHVAPYRVVSSNLSSAEKFWAEYASRRHVAMILSEDLINPLDIKSGWEIIHKRTRIPIQQFRNFNHIKLPLYFVIPKGTKKKSEIIEWLKQKGVKDENLYQDRGPGTNITDRQKSLKT